MTNTVTLETSNIIIGVILLDVDVRNSIEPLIRNWPGMGNTGETLLVRREGNNVVYLNDLRHKQDAALKLAISIHSTPDIASVLSSGGKDGIKESMDYRNVRVLSAYRYIPVLNWGLVAKQDLKEAFAPVEKLKNHVMALIFVCITLVIALGISFTKAAIMRRDRRPGWFGTWVMKDGEAGRMLSTSGICHRSGMKGSRVIRMKS